jgi:tetratricopeptide (TPR) repeat protein
MTTETRCLTPEQLGALATGQLSDAERSTAAAHVAACVDCREILADIVRLAIDDAPAPAATPQAAIYWGRRRWAAMVAAAAALVVVMWGGWAAWHTWQSPHRRVDGAVSQLASAIGSSRPVEARLNGGFSWGPPPAITRGMEPRVFRPGDLPFDAQQAILTIRRLAATQPDARALDAAGVASLIEGDVNAAVTTLEEAVRLDPMDARALGDLAAAHAEQWRRSRAPADAAASLDAAERALAIVPTDPVSRFNHALSVEALGLRDAALESWRLYLELDNDSEWANEARDHIARLMAGGQAALEPPTSAEVVTTNWAAARQTCYQRAVERLDASRQAFDQSRLVEAEQLARQARDSLTCAQASTVDADAQIAWSVFFQGRADDAMPLARRVLQGAGTSAGHAVSAGRMHYVLGLIDARAGRYSEADARYERAIAAFQTVGDREMAAAASVLRADVARFRADRVDSWARLEPAFAALPHLSPRRRHLTLVSAISTAEWFGLRGAATFFADTLVAINGRSDDAALKVGAYLQSATARLRLGRVDAALDVIAAAESTAPAIEDRTLRAQFNTEIALAIGRAELERRPERAIAAFDAALEDLAVDSRPIRRARALLGRGRAHQHAGRQDAAVRDWTEGAALFEDQRPEIRDEQWRIDHRDELWDLFRELIRVQADNPLASLEVAERLRGRALLDARSRTQLSAPLQGSALHAWLPNDVTVVMYQVLPDALYRWTVTSGGARLDRQDLPERALAALVDDHVARVARNQLAGDSALSALLLPRSLSPATADRLVFIPDGPLYRVPFATLSLHASNRLVVDEFVSQVAPSLTMLRAAGGRSVTPSRAVLVAAGDPHPRENLPALPGATAEVAVVRALYRSPLVLTGADATPAAMRSSLGAADVVHFAGHVIADGVIPSRSRLLLSAAATPSTLTFADLRDVSMRAGATVVLSACESAQGRVFTGEGAVGLPFVFLAGGASSVVATLWAIDDATPAAIWREFHERLRAGAPPSVALAHVQRYSRQSGVPPAMWAAFEVIGGLVQS